MPKAKAKAKPKKNGKPRPKPKAPSKQPQGSMRPFTAPAAAGVDADVAMSWEPRDDGGIAQGREYLAQVVVPEGDNVGANVANFSIAPGEFGGTRLSLKGQEYQKFLFHELDFEYVPAVGSQQVGSLAFSYNRDIGADIPPATEQGLRQYLALKDSKFGNVWLPHVCKCPLRAQKEPLWTEGEIGGDDRLAFQGQFNVATMVPTGSAAGTVLGTIILKYKCQFWIATLEDELESAEVSNGTPAAFSTGNYDLIGKVATAAPTVDGEKSWVGRLQGDGTYALQLKEGLYRLLSFIGPATWSGTGTATINAPTITAIEADQQPATEYQAIAENTVNGSSSAEAPVTEGYLTVPRGGALVRQTFTTTSSLAATGASIVYNLLRVGAPLLGALSGVLTRTLEARVRTELRARAHAVLAMARGETVRFRGTIGSGVMKSPHRPRSRVVAANWGVLTFSVSADGKIRMACTCGFVHEVAAEDFWVTDFNKHLRHADAQIRSQVWPTVTGSAPEALPAVEKPAACNSTKFSVSSGQMVCTVCGRGGPYRRVCSEFCADALRLQEGKGSS